VDVVFGALVGTLFAHMAYRMCYRSVYDSRVNHIPLEGDGGEKDGDGGKEA
jgi:diacylglycerol diphosphate phosphatase/phosphatidate phosphatase